MTNSGTLPKTYIDLIVAIEFKFDCIFFLHTSFCYYLWTSKVQINPITVWFYKLGCFQKCFRVIRTKLQSKSQRFSSFYLNVKLRIGNSHFTSPSKSVSMIPTFFLYAKLVTLVLLLVESATCEFLIYTLCLLSNGKEKKNTCTFSRGQMLKNEKYTKRFLSYQDFR